MGGWPGRFDYGLRHVLLLLLLVLVAVSLWLHGRVALLMGAHYYKLFARNSTEPLLGALPCNAPPRVFGSRSSGGSLCAAGSAAVQPWLLGISPGRPCPKKAVSVPLRGRFGNNLFQLGAALTYAQANSLRISPELAEERPDLPCLYQAATLGVPRWCAARARQSRNTMQLQDTNYQTSAWVRKFEANRVQLCYFMRIPSPLPPVDSGPPRSQQPASPGPDDAVVYLRDFAAEMGLFSGEYTVNTMAEWYFDEYTTSSGGADEGGGEGASKRILRLGFPATQFFTSILERGPGYIEYDAINGVDQYNRRGPSRTWNKVWIVANPAIHGHPLIAHLCAKFSAVVRNGTAAEDFAFLSAARTILLSPSTFGWWAAFFSSDATTVHFPIMPGPVPMPWCDLMLGGGGGENSAVTAVIPADDGQREAESRRQDQQGEHTKVADDETHRSTERLRSRYRYHDWFNGRTFASDAAGLQQAREACYALESNSDLNSSELVRELTSRSREFFLW